VPLGELAAFYALPIPEDYARCTAAEMFANHFEGEVQIGDRLPVGPALLVVRRVEDGRAAQIGIVLPEAPLAGLSRRWSLAQRWPWRRR